jgi:predicted phage terminase large subunit-like protein
VANVFRGHCLKCGKDDQPFAAGKNSYQSFIDNPPKQCMDCLRDEVRIANLVRKRERENQKKAVRSDAVREADRNRKRAQREAKKLAEKEALAAAKTARGVGRPTKTDEEQAETARQKAEAIGLEIPEDVTAKQAQDRLHKFKKKLGEQGLAAVHAERHEADMEMQRTLSLEHQALREAARREICKRSLLHLIKAYEAEYEAGWVHRYTCKKLERFLMDVIDKKSPRLMIFMPPRTGKSLIASQYFPLFALANFPWLEIIATSYALTLPLGFSKKIRAFIRSEESFNNIFPALKLDPDTTGAEHWLTTKGGGFRAAGVGGPITGTGGHILIIDDPVKNWEEAESESQRETVWNWYTSTLYTRQAPGAGILVIQTRWHDDDLSGRLLELEKQGLGDGFEVISFPAIAVEDERFRKKGEALHPERYDVEALRRIEKTVGTRVWNALYQQNPTPDDGEYFKRGHFRYYDKVPPLHTLRIYAGWDLAITSKEENDPSCGVIVGVDADDYWYILELYLGRWEADALIDQICTSLEVWRPQSTWIEREKITLALGPSLEREIERRRLTASHIQDVPPGRRDKMARARAAQALMGRHRILFPRDADWTPTMQGELLRFPNGKHDDQVDALALVCQMGSLEAPPEQPRGEKNAEGWREKVARLGVQDKSAMSG